MSGNLNGIATEFGVGWGGRGGSLAYAVQTQPGDSQGTDEAGNEAMIQFDQANGGYLGGGLYDDDLAMGNYLSDR